MEYIPGMDGQTISRVRAFIPMGLSSAINEGLVISADINYTEKSFFISKPFIKTLKKSLK